MTKQSTEALIAESREVARQYDPAFRFVLDRVIDRLEAVAKDSSTGQQMHAYWQQRAEEAEAVVEKVRAICDKALAVRVVESSTSQAQDAGSAAVILREALASAPADTLRERDAALIEGLADEFAARLPDGTGNGRAYNSHAVAQMLREKARQKREETSA